MYLFSEREEEDALEQARQAHIAREQHSDVDKQKAQRDKERLKEQEKRRRLAVSIYHRAVGVTEYLVIIFG